MGFEKLDGDEKYQDRLFKGYVYTIAHNLKNQGLKTKKEVIDFMRNSIILNVKDFNINQDRGKANKINKHLKDLLWYFED